MLITAVRFCTKVNLDGGGTGDAVSADKRMRYTEKSYEHKILYGKRTAAVIKKIRYDFRTVFFMLFLMKRIVQTAGQAEG